MCGGLCCKSCKEFSEFDWIWFFFCINQFHDTFHIDTGGHPVKKAGTVDIHYSWKILVPLYETSEFILLFAGIAFSHELTTYLEKFLAERIEILCCYKVRLFSSERLI